jgi:hypothetical protein
LRYLAGRKTLSHLSREPPLPSDHSRDPFNELQKALAQNGSKNCATQGKSLKLLCTAWVGRGIQL